MKLTFTAEDDFTKELQQIVNKTTIDGADILPQKSTESPEF